MPHVFVESNWLFAVAAPAHHQVPAAVELLERARHGEFILHLPNVCIGEAREAILTKCQPRREADAIRRFLTWAEPAGRVSKADAAVARGYTATSRYLSRHDVKALSSRLGLYAYVPVLWLETPLAGNGSLGRVVAKP